LVHWKLFSANSIISKLCEWLEHDKYLQQNTDGQTFFLLVKSAEKAR